MTVIFSLLIIICGIIGSLCIVLGNIKSGILFFAIVVLCIVALIGRISYEKGLFSSIGSKKSESPVNTSIPKPVSDAADEIKKYKELYDSGAITEEEYNAKKKQLLGL